MQRQTATSARSLTTGLTSTQTLQDARAASSGAITGKKSTANAAASTTTTTTIAVTPSSNFSRTAPTGKAPSTASRPVPIKDIRSYPPEETGRTLVSPPAEPRRRQRRAYKDDSPIPQLADDGETNSDGGVQYVVCQKRLCASPGNGTGAASTTTTTTTTPLLRNGRVVATSPSPPSTEGVSPTSATAPSDLIMAQGGPPPPSAAAITGTKSPTALVVSDAALPRILSYQPHHPTSSGVPDTGGTSSSSALDSGASVPTTSILHTSTRASAHLGTGSQSSSTAGPSLPEVDHSASSPPAGNYSSHNTSLFSNAGRSGATRGPANLSSEEVAAHTPSHAPTTTGYRDLDAVRESKSKSPAAPGATPSKRLSRSISPTRSPTVGESPVVRISAEEEGNAKSMTHASSRRNLLDALRRPGSSKDLSKSVTSTQAPRSRSASIAALKGGGSGATGGSGDEEETSTVAAPTGTWVYQHKPGGLYNFGATCYMNAALQCMMHTPNFLTQLDKQHRRFQGFTNSEQEAQGTKPTKNASRASSFRFKPKEKDDPSVATGTESPNPTTTTNITTSTTATMTAASTAPRTFAATAALTDLGLEKPHRAPRQLLQEVKAAAGSYNDQFKGNGQNDAHEFLRTILYVVHDEVNQGQGRTAPYEALKDKDNETEAAAMQRWSARLKLIDDSVVYDLFGGVLQSTCECLTCKHLSRTFDPFLDLSIPVHNANASPPPAVAGAPTTNGGAHSSRHNTPRTSQANDVGSSSGTGGERKGGLSTNWLDTDATLEDGSPTSATEWQSGGQGSSKPMLPALTASGLPTFARDRNGSITRDELGSLCLNAPANLIRSCSVDDIVSECFAQETQELMSGDNKLTCEQCKAPRDVVRRCKVSAWPKVLVLHLKRFTGDGHKDFTKVTYPQTFTLPQNQTLLRYRLCGVVCHSGSERFGHYTSYVSVHKEADDLLCTETPPRQRSPSQPNSAAKPTASGKSDPAAGAAGVVRRLHTQLETWYLCNDERISKVDAKEALSALENAYILFYYQSP